MARIVSDQREERLRGIIDEYTAGGDERKIPGLVYCAFRGDGEPVFQHCSGTAGISSRRPMTSDAVFWAASFTKVLTSIACMQLVEKGLLRLDDADQIESISHELRDVKVLSRDESGNFLLVEKTRKITLRMLLTHTAGFGYAFEDEKLAQYGQPIGLDDFSGEREDIVNRPLLSQPGETFQYGTSMDWVGIIIERVSGLSLDEFFQKNILQPLQLSGISFYPSEQAKHNLVYMHRRLPGGRVIQADHLYRRPLVAKTDDHVFAAGGHGCFGPPLHWARLCALLLNGGTDAKTGTQILRPVTVQEMLKDQIVNTPRYSNEYVPVAKPLLANPTPLEPMPDDHTEGWGLSFSISHQPAPSGRAAGSASWEGLANLYWFVDPKNNVGAIIGTQILPYDKFVLECFDRVEREIYEAIRERDGPLR